MSWLCKELLFSRGRRFFSSPKHPDWLWGPPTSCSVGMRGTSPGAKLPEYQPDFSPLSSAKVKNEWSCTITPHTPLWYTKGHFYPYQYAEWCTVGNSYVWLLKKLYVSAEKHIQGSLTSGTCYTWWWDWLIQLLWMLISNYRKFLGRNDMYLLFIICTFWIIHYYQNMYVYKVDGSICFIKALLCRLPAFPSLRSVVSYWRFKPCCYTTVTGK